jgi:hypothetical protein
MSELAESSLVWNRACGSDPVANYAGDCALRAMLRAHALVMNGGVLHAVECLTADDRTAAESGYRFYDADEIAALLSRAAAVLEAGQSLAIYEPELNREYWKLVPDDGTLVERFNRHFTTCPTAYAPL